MSILKERSAFFLSLSNKHRLVAHGRVVNGEERFSYFRLNDEEELTAATANWIHFPCVVHFDFSIRYTSEKNAVPKRKTFNAILVLDKAENPLHMDDVEGAKDRALEVVEDFVAYIRQEHNVNGYCGPFHNLDLSRFSVASYGPVAGSLFGWALQFEDEQYPQNILEFDQTKWF